MTSGAAPLVVTGPGGWIGTALLAVLARQHGAGWSERVRLFGASPRTLTMPDGSALAVRALASIGPEDVAGADLVHLAYLTREKADELGAEAFFATNRAIDDAVLAACAAAPPRAIFVASSGAAAMAECGRDRHLYGICKLLQEDRFLALGAASGVPVLAGRIYNLGGPWINKLGSYAISAMLLQALVDGTIDILAATPVYRSYLHVGDLGALVLAALDRGIGAARPVDLCGSEVVEMADLAARVAAAVGIGPAAIRRPLLDHAQPSAYVGDATQTMTLAARCDVGLRGLTEQIADTASFLAELPRASA